MLKIRLKRVGRRNDPSYRVVVTEATSSPKSGKSVEVIGSYNPKNNQKNIDAERASYWIGVGAQPSGTVHNLLVDAGVVKNKKVNVLPKKSPVKKEGGEETSTAKPTAGTPTETEEVREKDEIKEEPAENTPAEAVEAKEAESPEKEEPSEETPAQ